MKPNITIKFTFQDVPFHATGYYLPGDPGQVFGPPEHCWEPYPAEFSFHALHVKTANGLVDALWILDTSLGDAVHAAAVAVAEEILSKWEEEHCDE